MPDGDDASRDQEQYRELLALWKHENPIKTVKLQVLLAVNAGLAAAAQLAAGSPAPRWPLYAAGAGLSAVWLLSIGRTVLSQQLWKHKLNALAEKHPGDPRFHVLDTSDVENLPPFWLRLFGGVSSKFYLVGAPLALTGIWLALLVLST
jgi:hypothetical protein